MRKLFALVAVVAALAIGGPRQANAEVEFCLVDPPVTVSGTVLQVGLYTTNSVLLTDISGPIQVWLRPASGQTVTTNVASWSGRYPTTVQTTTSAPMSAMGTLATNQSFEVDAYVPAAQGGETFFIRVILPNGTMLTATGPVNALVRLPVPLTASA